MSDRRDFRRDVFERDRGVCARCAIDCEKARRVYWLILDSEAQWFYGEVTGFIECVSFWQADHVREIAAGGADVLNNLQTLCLRCHKAKTSDFCRYSGYGGRPPAGLPLTLRPVRLDDDVWAAIQAMKGKFKTINEGFRAAFGM